MKTWHRERAESVAVKDLLQDPRGRRVEVRALGVDSR